MNSLNDEIKFLFSGKGMPYEKVCMTVTVVVTVVLCYLMTGNFAKDAKVVVIDVDNSAYSRELTSRFNATEYMKVTAVVNAAVNPTDFFYRDQAIAVIYLPRDLEKNRFSGTDAAIGVFYDNTNVAQTANIQEALNEIVALDNAMQTTGGTLYLYDRILFSPNGSTSNAQTQGFLFFFGSMFFVFATIGMVPRLRMTHELDRILTEGTPWDLIGRLVPYCVCVVVSFVFGMAILRVWGDMVFSGSLLDFLFTQIFYVIALGMLSLLFGWGAANPGIASSRMILFIPGGFILGGPTSPVDHLAEWVQTFSHVFPLTWEFHFVRDIVARGASIADIDKEFGAFLVYLAVVAVIFCVKFYGAKKEFIQRTKNEEIMQQKLHNMSVARG